MLRCLRPRSFVAGVFVLQFMFAAAPSAQTQGSAEDYRRAAELWKRFDAELLLGVPKDLRWLDGGTLEYRVERAAGEPVWVFLDVAAEGGPERVEVSLGDLPLRASGLPASSRIAAARRVAPERYQLLMDSGGLWSWSPGDERLTWLDGAQAHDWHWLVSTRERRTTGTGASTYFWCANATDERLQLQWVDDAGSGTTYATLAPGEGYLQQTYAGHAWRLVDEAGEVRFGFRAEERVGIVWLDETEGSGPAKRKRLSKGAALLKDRAQPKVVVREHNLWWIDAANGVEKPLSSDGTEAHPYLPPQAWNESRTRALVLRMTRPEVRQIALTEARPKDSVQPEVRHLDYTKPGDERPTPSVYLLQVDEQGAGGVQPLDPSQMPEPWSFTEIRHDRARDRFTLLYNERGHGVLRWLAVDPDSAEVRVLIDEDPESFVDYTNKVFLHELDRRPEALWTSERSGWNHLYAVDLEDGSLRALTQGPWVVRRVEGVFELEGWVLLSVMGYFADQDPYHVHYLRVPLDGGDPVPLTRGDGTHVLQFSPARHYFVDTYSRVDLPPIAQLRRTADGALLETLEVADSSALRKAGWQPPQRFAANGRDGTTPIWGIVHRPTNFDPARSYPVIEQIYAGPHDHHVPKAFQTVYGAQAIAELGFVVVQIDGMGTNWRSKAFHDVCWKNLGDAGLPDRMAWIRALAREDRSLDLDRVGIYGGSAGGQNALGALLMHPAFYRAGVADCGCHDNRMDKIWWNEMWMGYPVGPHYAEQSNVTRAHRLQGDLLLIVGALDSNVDPQSTLQVVDALIAADKDFELLVMPSEGHGAAESAYGARRRQDFFVRKLLGRKPRWEP